MYSWPTPAHLCQQPRETGSPGEFQLRSRFRLYRRKIKTQKDNLGSLRVPKSVNGFRTPGTALPPTLSQPTRRLTCFIPTATNLITQPFDTRTLHTKHITMVSNRTLLASFLVLAVLSSISTAGAFSGRFEVSDLCVDSPFQKDATSIMNSTVSCRSHSLLTNSNLSA